MNDQTTLGTEDLRGLYAEINQLLNQRFLITTAAITVCGAFSSLTIPKDISQEVPGTATSLAAGTCFLQSFLVLLFLWNRFLGNYQSKLVLYLEAVHRSKYSADWKKYHEGRGGITTGSIQTWVFLALGAMTTLWPFVISAVAGYPFEWGWMAWALFVAAAYGVVVYGFGIKQWLRRDEEMRNRWSEVVAVSDGPSEKAPAPSGPPEGSPATSPARE